MGQATALQATDPRTPGDQASGRADTIAPDRNASHIDVSLNLAGRKGADTSRTAAPASPSPLFWTRGFSLTTRILAVNILIVGLFAGGLFFLDSYRKQLLAERFKLARSEVEIIANALAEAPSSEHAALLARIGAEQQLRLRTFDAKGALQTDSFVIAEPSFAFADPAEAGADEAFARWLDRGVDFLVGAPPVLPYEPQADAVDRAVPHKKDQFAEIFVAEQAGSGAVRLRYAPDRTPVITAAAPYGAQGETVLTLRNATDITQAIRSARQTLLIVLALVILLSVQMSLFLARTIVQPLKLLAGAAARVRLGREREVVVPRLPERGDEIGLLARALSDMTGALRERIDAGEAFAADVSHELKNPLASLRSALETLTNVDDPDLRSQLMDIAQQDVRRIDRLITEIADANRVDAELSRATFLPVDLFALAQSVIGGRTAATRIGEERQLSFAVRGAPASATMVTGDAARLERVLENLIDNAASFSPPQGSVVVAFNERRDWVEMTVTDDGPGIEPADRERIFERFHSHRPDEDSFGSHSGLGLAIARAIVIGHGGSIHVRDRKDEAPGAEMVITLPAMTT
ncbi:ATP-binding protein [Croceicoccus sp. F390]|uniref:histidine kinase n=1 Tax=Croceicoccus esteveae TaxID=3075597 RepID=A0ABU2ZGX3_9SPHN|nr:ATP-binding protein [Croceicoccus sp. F390]MDT0575569.1 ATP-binding protein [Croceicoccus sp. F390]